MYIEKIPNERSYLPAFITQYIILWHNYDDDEVKSATKKKNKKKGKKSFSFIAHFNRLPYTNSTQRMCLFERVRGLLA